LQILFTGINSPRSRDSSSLSGIAKVAHLLGHKICWNLADEPDLLICLDYHPRFNQTLKKAKGLGVPIVLIKQEPPAIIPQHRLMNPGNFFDKVVTKGSSKEDYVFNCLLSWDTSFIRNPQRIERVIAVSADKWSFVSGELYSLRLRAYSEDSRIDLYGNGWSQSTTKRLISRVKSLYVALTAGEVSGLNNLRIAFRKPLHYLGPVVDKLQAVSKYKVSLVIENDMSAMSEKLVDTILSGTIPVYVGPPVEPFGIPTDLVVQAQPEISDVFNAITRALASDSEAYRHKANIWAESRASRVNWDPNEVDHRLMFHVITWYQEFVKTTRK